MSSSLELRNNTNQHTVKNSVSVGMEKELSKAMRQVEGLLKAEYPEVELRLESRIYLHEIIGGLKRQHPAVEPFLAEVQKKTCLRPDGGVLFAKFPEGEETIILVAEAKKQGTNDQRETEGLPAQAMGNAIERLGKNLIGIRAAMRGEKHLPFVCFGAGRDFAKGSSILDRVITMNDFFPLNVIHVDKTYLPFEPVSMFFREEPWSVAEMTDILHQVAKRALDARKR